MWIELWREPPQSCSRTLRNGGIRGFRRQHPCTDTAAHIGCCTTSNKNEAGSATVRQGRQSWRDRKVTMLTLPKVPPADAGDL